MRAMRSWTDRAFRADAKKHLPEIKETLNNVRFIVLIMRYHTAIETERRMAMFSMRNVGGHVQVYDMRGNFLFSADNEREAREELEEYAQSAA